MPCPGCGEPLDQAAAVGGPGPRLPRDGSISICAYCADVSVFTVSPLGTLDLRPMTAEELTRFQGDPEAMKVLRTIQEYLAGERR